MNNSLAPKKKKKEKRKEKQITLSLSQYLLIFYIYDGVFGSQRER